VEDHVGQERAHNIHLGGGCSREQLVALRSVRDATLDTPRLILHSLHVNMRAGGMPVDASGRPMVRRLTCGSAVRAKFLTPSNQMFRCMESPMH